VPPDEDIEDLAVLFWSPGGYVDNVRVELLPGDPGE
jgi:hypothetical protein